MIFGVGFRLVLVAFVLAVERIGSFFRTSGIVETIRSLWPQDFRADVDRLRDALRPK